MTKYEAKILNIINTSHDHLTSEDIFLKLKEEEPKVVLATVYNNLNRLYEKDQIVKLSIPGHPDRYDNRIRHDHLVCNVCKKITDCSFSDLTKEIEAALGQSIGGYDLKISYTCPDCKKQRIERIRQ